MVRAFLFLLVCPLFFVDSFAQRRQPKNTVEVEVIESRRQSEISTNLYTCVGVFDEFSADCELNFWVLEFRWFPRRDGAANSSSFMPISSFFRSSRPIPADIAGGGRWGGGFALSVDDENTTPPPAPPSDAWVDKEFRPQISHSNPVADTTNFPQHNGFYSAQIQGVLSLPSPFDPKVFNINAFAGVGFAWIRERDPSVDRAGVEGKGGIPTISYGAEAIYNFNRFNVRLQLNNTVYYPNDLNYVFDRPNGPEVITQNIKSIRKLNLLFGVGYVILP